MIATVQQGAVQVLAPQGPLLEESRQEFEEAIAEAANGPMPMVVLNLAETPMLDSTGLEALLDARDEVRQHGGTIKLAAPTQLAADILHATGVGGAFEQFDDVRAAVGSFAR